MKQRITIFENKVILRESKLIKAKMNIYNVARNLY